MSIISGAVLVSGGAKIVEEQVMNKLTGKHLTFKPGLYPQQ
jgi:hypothetical protein